MKVALVHDYLNQYGGAERVLEVFCELFPDAPIYTLFYDEKKTKGRFRGRQIIASFLDRGIIGKFFGELDHFFFWLLPKAVERFQLDGYDAVIISSATFAKGVRVPTGIPTILYCHTPTRYLWEDVRKYTTGWLRNPVLIRAAEPFFRSVRHWDFQAAQKPHWVVVNSSHIARRFEQVYQRPVHAVFWPPIDTTRFYTTNKKENYFLAVGRLLGYKRFDIAVEACNTLKLPLKIVGEGREIHRLRRMAGPTVEFLGWVNDEALPELYAKAQALLFPQIEDFGLVAVESLASGTPVIAYRGGGILDIIEDGKTGILFGEHTASALVNAIKEFHNISFDVSALQHSAQKFDKAVFKKKFLEFLRKTHLI